MNKRYALACALLVASAGASAATAVPVHSFSGTPDGVEPVSGLVKGADGALYGSTQYGGIYGIDPHTNSGHGTIYRVDAENVYTALYSFTHLDAMLRNVDGRWPITPLLAGPDGALYGTTPYGGRYGGGAAFKFMPATGVLTPLRYFAARSDLPGGSQPQAALALGHDGRLYGSTLYGGTRKDGVGTVFAVGTDGSGFDVLRSFGGRGAAMPEGRLLAASDGLLYGQASSYGAGYPGGALYRIAPDGSGYQVVRAFDYASEGGFVYVSPKPQVIEGPEGYLYGALPDGGGGEGALYRVRPDGSGFQVLHSFDKLGTDFKNTGGGRVATTPVFGPDGLLYGATMLGGVNGTGTLYRMARDGSGFTTLYQFPAAGGQRGEPMGMHPTGDVAFNAKGQLCGTAYKGGLYGYGAVFCLKLD